MAKVSDYNDRIDSAKQAYETAKAKGDTAGMNEAHARAESIRSEASKAGYTAGNYVSSGSGTKSNVDTSNYSSDYDVATNYTRPVEDDEPYVKEPTNNYNTVAKQLADAQKQAQINALNKSYNNVLSQISQSEETTKENARNNRNNASVQNQLANARTARQLANAGLTNSGTNAQMQINSNGALQNNLGTITSNEQKALNDFLTQRNLAKSNLESDINSVNANVDATMLQNQLNYIAQMEQLKAQQDFQREMAQQEIDVNNIWDDTLGRYVPFSYYASTHPTSTVTSTGGSRSGSSGGGTTKVPGDNNGDGIVDDGDLNYSNEDIEEATGGNGKNDSGDKVTLTPKFTFKNIYNIVKDLVKTNPVLLTNPALAKSMASAKLGNMITSPADSKTFEQYFADAMKQLGASVNNGTTNAINKLTNSNFGTNLINDLYNNYF